MKALAAAVCWVGLLHMVGTLKDDEATHPSVVQLARSLLGLPAFYKPQTGDRASGMIRRIIRQHVDAKKLAVSSYEWSRILASMIKDGEQMTVSQAVELYNSNPEVVAHGGASSKDCHQTRCFKVAGLSAGLTN